MSLWDIMIPDINIERQHTLLCTESNYKSNGANVVVLSKFDATLNELPPGNITKKS